MEKKLGGFDLFECFLEDLLSSRFVICFVLQSEEEYIIEFDKHKTFIFNKKDFFKGEKKMYNVGRNIIVMAKKIGDELLQYSEILEEQIAFRNIDESFKNLFIKNKDNITMKDGLYFIKINGKEILFINYFRELEKKYNTSVI